MKCPHCNYQRGWNSETLQFEGGEQGDFWQLPVKLERREHFEDQYKNLYACPACSKTFIS